MNRPSIMFAIALLTWASELPAQSVPPWVNYQGHLTDAVGVALPTNDYSLTFRVFDDPVVGNLVWGPLHFDVLAGQPLPTGHKHQVPVVNGYFNVMLGELDAHEDPPGTPAPRSVLNAFNGAARYVEITIDEAGGGLPILPRQQVLSAPYALRAFSGGGEVGDVVMSMLSMAQFDQQRPGEWVLCDGRDVSDSRYHQLTGQSTAPDMRSRFPVAAGPGAGLTNRGLGQTGGEENHTLSLNEMPSHNHTYQHYYDAQPLWPDWGTPTGDDSGHGPIYGTGHSGGGLSHNNMPPFFAVNFFVRVN